MAMCTSGSLAIISAPQGGCSNISVAVTGNATPPKSLLALSIAAGKSAPHSMLEFRGYTSAATIVVTGEDSIGEICNGWIAGGSYTVTASENWYLTISNSNAATASQDYGSGNATIYLNGIGTGDGVTENATITFYRSSDNTVIAEYYISFTYYYNCY